MQAGLGHGHSLPWGAPWPPRACSPLPYPVPPSSVQPLLLQRSRHAGPTPTCPQPSISRLPASPHQDASQTGSASGRGPALGLEGARRPWRCPPHGAWWSSPPCPTRSWEGVTLPSTKRAGGTGAPRAGKDPSGAARARRGPGCRPCGGESPCLSSGRRPRLLLLLASWEGSPPTLRFGPTTHPPRGDTGSFCSGLPALPICLPAAEGPPRERRGRERRVRRVPRTMRAPFVSRPLLIGWPGGSAEPRAGGLPLRPPHLAPGLSVVLQGEAFFGQT